MGLKLCYSFLTSRYTGTDLNVTYAFFNLLILPLTLMLVVFSQDLEYSYISGNVSTMPLIRFGSSSC